MTQSLDLGGSERQLTQIARALDRRLFTPHVGYFRPGGVREQELRAAGIPLVQFPVSSFLQWSAMSSARMLRRYLREHHIRLVHSFDTPANIFTAVWARASGVATLLTSQRAHRGLVSAGRRRLLRMCDRRAHGIVVNCEFLRQHLIVDEAVPPGHIHVCYNGVDLAEFRQAAPRGADRPGRPAALSGAGLVIGTVCALRPEKDLATLLKAFDSLARSDQSLRLVIVGHGPSSEETRSLAARLDSASRIHFERGVSDVSEWLHAFDIFVLPSLSEAFSNSLLEAMACGCAVVASRTGGNPEIVGADETRGLLFPPGDAGALEQALLRLLTDSALRVRLAAAGAAFVRAQFSLDASVQHMQEIYRTAMSQSGR